MPNELVPKDRRGLTISSGVGPGNARGGASGGVRIGVGGGKPDSTHVSAEQMDRPDTSVDPTAKVRPNGRIKR